MKKFTLAAAFAALTLSASAQSLVTDATTSLSTIQNAKDVILVSVSEEVGTYFNTQGVVKADWSLNDATRHLYIWENTYEAGTPSGMNSVGTAEGWISLVVTSVGWSGMGFCYDDQDLTILDDDYIFHFAIKSQDNATHCLGIGEAKMALGESAFPDGKSNYPVLENFPRDGKWYNYNVPVSVIKNYIVGDKWFNVDDLAHFNTNFVWFLSGAATGTTLDLDQMYLYKTSGSDGIQNVVKAENENAAVYNLAGQKVDANYRGIVVKNGKKFMNK